MRERKRSISRKDKKTQREQARKNRHLHRLPSPGFWGRAEWAKSGWGLSSASLTKWVDNDKIQAPSGFPFTGIQRGHFLLPYYLQAGQHAIGQQPLQSEQQPLTQQWAQQGMAQHAAFLVRVPLLLAFAEKWLPAINVAATNRVINAFIVVSFVGRTAKSATR